MKRTLVETKFYKSVFSGDSERETNIQYLCIWFSPEGFSKYVRAEIHWLSIVEMTLVLIMKFNFHFLLWKPFLIK